MPCVLVKGFPKAYFQDLSHLPLIQLIELEDTCVDSEHQRIYY